MGRLANAVEAWTDWRLGIRTRQVHYLTEFGIHDPRCREVGSIPYRDFPVMARHFNTGGAFLDYGSGTGRAVVLAARLPFTQVIGVDLIDEVCNVARRNVATARGLRCGVEVVTASATEFAVPLDVLTVFLNNSFHGEILSGALERVRESLTQRPRDLRFLASVPAGSDHVQQLISDSGFLSLSQSLTLPSGRTLAVFHPPDPRKHLERGSYVQ